MSLLLQALQKAARNREQATAAAPDSPAAAPVADSRSMLELEPGEFDPDRSIGQDPSAPDAEETSRPLSLESAPDPVAKPQRPTYIDGVDEPTPQQAAALLNAASGAREPGFSVLDWARERPVYVFAGAAFVFLAGYGAYVYIAITQPGLLSGGGFTKQAPGAPVGPLTAAPRPSAAPDSAGAAKAQEAGSPLLPDITRQSPAGPAAATAKAPPTAGSEAQPAGNPPPTTVMSATRPARTNEPGTAAATPATGRPPNPESEVAAEPRAVPPAVAAPVAVATPSESVPRASRRRAPPADAPARKVEVRAGNGAATITSQLNDAYAASLKGDAGSAQDAYERVLAADPRNVDAMLGMASLAWQAGRTDQASELYYRVLQSEPHNAAAQAGLIGLVGRVDAVASETRLKQLIAREPSGPLYFALGNLYSSQGQWAQAQRAYFQAAESDSGNPDYIFNLAVALEHIGQPKPALANYRRALDLSFSRGATFDQKQVIARIGQLSLAVE